MTIEDIEQVVILKIVEDPMERIALSLLMMRMSWRQFLKSLKRE